MVKYIARIAYMYLFQFTKYSVEHVQTANDMKKIYLKR